MDLFGVATPNFVFDEDEIVQGMTLVQVGRFAKQQHDSTET